MSNRERNPVRRALATQFFLSSTYHIGIEPDLTAGGCGRNKAIAITAG